MWQNLPEKSRDGGQKAIKGEDKRPLLVNDLWYTFPAKLRLVRAHCRSV